MVLLLEVILASSAALLLHTWFGYPTLLYLAMKSKGRRSSASASEQMQLPLVSIIIPAYNASKIVINKLSNTLALDYPKEKYEVILVSDGSSDDTVGLAGSLRANNIKILTLNKNRGKSTAQNEGVKLAKGDIILFTDVNSFLERDFLKNIIPYFDDQSIACVGGVARHQPQKGGISESHGLYWKVEQFIKKAESELRMLISLPGWGFAVRRTDYVPLDPDTGDDMVMPMEMAVRGKRSVLASRAFVADTMPATLTGEFKARIRITLRNLTALMRRKQLLLPWRFPRLSFAIWSHKLLRWFSPFLLLAIFGCTLTLHIAENGFYAYALYLQIVFYIVGLVGFLFSLTDHTVPLTGHITSFLIANIGFLFGVLKYFLGHRVSRYHNT